MVRRIRLWMLLIFVALVAFSIAGIRTTKYISMCKSRALEFAEAEQRCLELAEDRLEEVSSNRAMHDGYFRQHKKVDEDYENFLLRRLNTEIAQGAEPEATIRKKFADAQAIRKKEQLDWEQEWKKNFASIESRNRELPRFRQKDLEWARYNARMKDKYRDAASHFWKPLTPDEPEPSME